MAQGVDDGDRHAWFEFGSLAELVGHDRRGPRHEDDLVAAHVGYDNLLRASGPCGTRHRAVSHRAVNGGRCAHGANRLSHPASSLSDWGLAERRTGRNTTLGCVIR